MYRLGGNNMTRGVRSRLSLVIAIMMLLSSFTINSADTIPLNSNGSADANGYFNVYYFSEDSWVFLDALPANMYFTDHFLNLPSDVLKHEFISIKILKDGGGKAHLDSISIDGVNPLTVSDLVGSHTGKVVSTDHDVIEVGERGLTFEFSKRQIESVHSDLILTFNGRIESEVIGQIPFVYPRSNGVKNIGTGSDFYEYRWDSMIGTNALDGDIGKYMHRPTLFKVKDRPVSGHPEGFTYGWLENDENYLYATLDFTPDNTLDGENDYSTMYVKTKSGVKPFKITALDQTWGLASFVRTSNAAYQHKLYEFRIPKDELGLNEGEPLYLAFTAYGTASMAPGTYETDIAYDNDLNRYLVAYRDYDDNNNKSALIGQFVDYDGSLIGSAFDIVTNSSERPEKVKIVFNTEDKEYAVVWNNDSNSNSKIYVVRLDQSGSMLSSAVDIRAEYGGQDTSKNPDISYSPDANNYCVMWEYSDGSMSTLEGAIINNTLTLVTPLDFGVQSSDMKNLDLSYNETDQQYVVAYESGTIEIDPLSIMFGAFSTNGQRISINQVMQLENNEVPIRPNITYNILQDKSYITWLDNEDGLVLIGQYATVSSSAIILKSSLNLYDDIEYVSKPLAVNAGPSKDSMLVIWSEYESGELDTSHIKGQLLNSDGTTRDSVIDIFSGPGVVDDLSVVQNTQSGAYLIGFSYRPFYGSAQLVVVQVGGGNASGVFEISNPIHSVIEGENAVIVIERSNGSDGQAGVDYEVMPITTNMTDHVVTSGTAIFLNGETSKNLIVPTLNDSEAEPDETFSVTISNPTSGAALGITVTSTVTIIDDDTEEEPQNNGPSEVSFSADQYSVEEGHNLTLALNRTGDLNGTASVYYETVSGSATGLDFIYDSGTIIFGDQESLKLIEIETVNDEVTESNEKFTVVLSASSGSLLGEYDTAEITIVDASDPLSLGQLDPDIAYGSGSNQYLLVYEDYDEMTYQAGITGQIVGHNGNYVGTPFSIAPKSSAHPWMPVVVYNSVENEFLVAWNELVGSGDITYYKIVKIDGLVEVSEQPTVSVTNQLHQATSLAYNADLNNYCIVWEQRDLGNSRETIEGVIVDSKGNKSPMAFNIIEEAHQPNVIYDSVTGTFKITYVDVNGSETKVMYSEFTGLGTAVVENMPLNDSVLKQFAPVQSRNHANTDDYVVWAEEDTDLKIMGTLKSVSGNAIEITELPSFFVSENHDRLVYDLSNMRLFWIDSGNSESGTFEIFTQAITDSNTLSDQPQLIDSDTDGKFESITSAYNYIEDDYLIAYSHDGTSGSAIRVVYLDMGESEDSVTSGSAISFDASSIFTKEGESLNVTVERTGDLIGTSTVDYLVSTGTAGSSDFTHASGTLTFAGGVSSQSFQIPIILDVLDEESEQFTITLSNPTGRDVELGLSLITVTIIDVPHSEIGMAASTVQVSEGNTATVIVSRTGNDTHEDTVQYTVSYGTTDAQDHSISSGSLTFASGENTQYINIPILSDTSAENAESFTVTLSNPTGSNVILGQSTTTVTIDDVPYSEVGMSLSALSVEEGNVLSLVVIRTGNTTGIDTVQYNSAFGSTDSTDHELVSGTLTFEAGISTKTIQIQTFEDSTIEANENFTVTLVNPSNGMVLGAIKTSTVTVINDDVVTGMIGFEQSAVSVTEGDSTDIVIKRMGGQNGEIRVAYTLLHNTTDSSDVVASSGTLTFEEGEIEKTIAIHTIEDQTVEPIEEFSINLTSVDGDHIAEQGQIIILILNDDVVPDEDDDPITPEPDVPPTIEEEQLEQDQSSGEDIENLSNTIIEKLIEDPESMSNNVAEAYLSVIERNIEEIEDEEVLSKAITSYVDTIKAIGSFSEEPEQKEWIEEQVVKISEVVTTAIQKIEDDTTLMEIANDVITEIQLVEDSASLEKTVEVKETVEALAQSVLNKISEVDIESTVTLVDGISEVSFEHEELATTIAEKAANFAALTETFNEYYGDDNIREFDFEITLSTERVADQVQVPISQDIIDTLNDAGVDALSVEVGGTTVTIDQEVYSTDATEDGPDLVVDMKFDNQGFEVRDENINFKSGYVTDVRVFVGDEEKTKLEKPVELAFDLNAFEFWEEDYNPSSLSIYKLDEETGTWEPVGGIYDPITNTVKTRRLTLSQYTVMQSNKSFSDVENSWAKDEINELLGKGILDETASFNPTESITREEFTTWVARAYGVVDDGAQAPFSDIDTDHEHYTELASAYNAGIIAGSGDGKFDPNTAMTKEQMSAILANAMTNFDEKKLNEGLAGATLASASDSNLVSDWAGDDVAMLIELGVLDNSTGEINPQQELSKEEAASILKKIYG